MASEVHAVRIGYPRRLLSTLGAVGVVATALTGILFAAAGRSPTPLDSAWHDAMQAVRTPAGIAISTWLDIAGGVSSMVLIGLVLTVALLVARRPWEALTLAASMVLTEAITGILKVLVARPRPADSLADTGLTSYPSGHTALAAATMVVLAIVIGHRFWVIAATWVVLIAGSRTYLEAHWLTDVVAGAVLGTSIALLVCGGVRGLRRVALRTDSREAEA